MGRSVVIFIISLLLTGALASEEVLGQSPQQSPSQERNLYVDLGAIIERAEANYRKGEEAFAKSQLALSRRYFNKAIDEILLSGVDIKSNSRLEAYYRDLVSRIHKHEAIPGDDHSKQEKAEVVEPSALKENTEVVEPSVLDELSDIKETDLPVATLDGVKIFGEYDFNFSIAPPVVQFIEYFVSGRGRSTMEVGLRRSGRYREMAERIFKEEGVPPDLIWLAQAESVWKPNALSRAAAKGIWQFIPSTGTRFGLAQTQWIDERSQPEKSTRAAARYLRWLNGYFAGDWLLAMAAYNSGEGRVAGAIASCGYADFWELHRRNLLPQETRNYVPIILSIIIVSKNQDRYEIDVKPDPTLEYDTFPLPDQTDLKVAADLLGVPYETMQNLNPELRRGVSPPDQTYALKLPKGMKKRFEIAYAKLPEDQRVRKVVIPAEEIARSSKSSYSTRLVSYRVRRGDTLTAVARRHGVSVQELAKINKISSRTRLRSGQTIRVPKKVSTSKAKSSKSRTSSKKVSNSKSKPTSKKATSSRTTKRGKNGTRSRSAKSGKKPSRRR
ncbi:MAG: transglycosylase SLT domain-containing protein [Blastocatellia bacterium]|nr:transglycosylase SLT domain-containing protein [Blastocatellia bacterium]